MDAKYKGFTVPFLQFVLYLDVLYVNSKTTLYSN